MLVTIGRVPSLLVVRRASARSLPNGSLTPHSRLTSWLILDWAFVEFDPMLGVLEASEKQTQLARCLTALLKLDGTDSVRKRRFEFHRERIGSKPDSSNWVRLKYQF